MDDAQTPASSLTVLAASSNPSLIPVANIALGGSGASRTIRATPVANQNGSATVTLTVGDGQGLTASTSFTVTVNSVNDIPNIAAIANVSTTAGTATTAQPFTVGDVETAASSLTLSAASSNPSLIPVASVAFGGSGANRTVTATPVSGQSGASTLTVTVNDGQGGNASSSFVVNVSAPTNTAPTIAAIANQTISEDNATATLAFTVGDTQTAASSLTVVASSSNPALIPVANITLGGSGANRTIRATPTTNQSGSTTIILTVSDAEGLTAISSFTITVNSVNDAPAISAIANVTTTAGTATTAQTFTVGDVETAAGSLTLSAASSNPTLIPVASIAFGGSGANRTVTATPVSGQTGTSTLTVTVSDGQGGSASSSFTVTVNAAPNTAPTITTIANQNTSEDTATATLTFTVGDSQTAVGTLTVAPWSSNPALAPVANITLGGSGANRTVRIAPMTNQSGVATISLTVTDEGGLSASTSFTVTVNSVNDAPTISAIANVSTSAGSATTAQAFTVGDVETAAGSLTLSASSSNPTLIPVANIAFGGSGGSRTVTATPASGQSGTSTLTVTVSDGQGGSASSSFVVVVNPPAVSFAAYWNFDEPSGSTAYESINHRDGFLSGVTRTNGVSGGALLFDGINAVLNVNSASDLSPTTNMSISLWFKPSMLLDSTTGRRDLVKKPLSFWLMFNYPSADGRLTFALNSGLPKVHSTTASWQPDRWYHLAATYDGAALRLYVNGVLEGTSPASIPAATNNQRIQIGGNTDQYDSYCFAGAMDEVRFFPQPLAAADVTALFDSFKSAANSAPTISAIADASTTAGMATAVLPFTLGDAETAAGSLTLSAASSNPSLIPVANIVFGGSGANRTVTAMPVSNLSGSGTITVTVSDGQGGSASRSFTVTVRPRPPTLLMISAVADQSLAQGAAPLAVPFVVAAGGAPAENLVVSGASSNPALVPNTGVVIGGAGTNRTVTIMPAAGMVGETLITLTVSDGSRAAQHSFRCTVVSNTPPNVLALATVGEGAVTPNLAGKALVVGKSYTLTAKPAAGFLFAGWEGMTNCTRTTLTIILRTNTHLLAKFVRNPFLPAVGSFNGLFHEADEVRHDTSGRFTLTLGSTGTFSARIVNGSRIHAWTGRFALDGLATNIIRRSTNLGNLTIVIGLDAASNLISGTVSAPTWQAALTADRAGYWTSTNRSPYAARYTALLPSAGDGITMPSGVGFASGTISTGGLATLSATLPDSRLVTVSQRVSKDGKIPFYAWVLSGRGSVLGWLNCANQTNTQFAGTLSWSRPYISGAKYYPAGFTNDLPIVGARYVAPNLTNSILNFTTGEFVARGGNLPADFSNNILLQPPAKVVNLSSNKLSVAFTTTTGRFTGTAKDPASNRTITFNGVALQGGLSGTGYAAGQFLGTNQIGAVFLGPDL